jgi:hypothetical protein
MCKNLSNKFHWYFNYINFLATREIEPANLRSEGAALSTTQSQGIIDNDSSITSLICFNEYQTVRGNEVTNCTVRATRLNNNQNSKTGILISIDTSKELDFYADFQRQRYSVAYSKGHTASMFYYYYFFPEALHMEGVVVKTLKGAHSIGNQ